MLTHYIWILMATLIINMCRTTITITIMTIMENTITKLMEIIITLTKVEKTPIINNNY